MLDVLRSVDGFVFALIARVLAILAIIVGRVLTADRLSARARAALL